MKRNIDLTESMIFSRGMIFSRKSLPNIRGLRKIHWEGIYKIPIIDKSSIIDGESQIIPLGNKEERTLTKECLETESRNFCDCCGINLLEIPWDRYYGLCGKCAKYFNKTSKIPWVNTEPIRNNRTNMMIG